MVGQILLATLISSLLLIAEHYWPWHAMLKKPLNKIAAYVLGTLAIHIPLTGLLIIWGEWPIVYGLWAITIVGGGVVATINHLDTYLETRTRMEISESEAQSLRPDNGPDER